MFRRVFRKSGNKRAYLKKRLLCFLFFVNNEINLRFYKRCLYKSDIFLKSLNCYLCLIFFVIIAIIVSFKKSDKLYSYDNNNESDHNRKNNFFVHKGFSVSASRFFPRFLVEIGNIFNMLNLRLFFS